MNSSSSSSSNVANTSSLSRIGSRSRYLLVSLVFEACHYLVLPNVTCSLAGSYLHHLLDFNGWEDITESQQKVLLSACVYLACKVTEQLRSMRDAFNILSILKDADVSLTALEDEYVRSKSRIIEAEHQLLRILQFDVEMECPNKYLLNIARYLGLTQAPVHLAWTLLNDSLQSKRYVCTSADTLTVAALFISLEMCSAHHIEAVLSSSNDEGEDGRKSPLKLDWYKDFNIKETDLASASSWLLAIWEEKFVISNSSS